MKRYFLPIFIFLILPVFAFAAPQDVLITEIMYDLEGSDEGAEWIEIYNGGRESVTLVGGTGQDGWRVYEEHGATQHNHTLSDPYQGTMTLVAGEYAVIAQNGAKFQLNHSQYGGKIFISSAFSLSNTSQTIGLKIGSGGAAWGNVSYANTMGANGDGKSLQLQNGQWIAAVPTPGIQNYFIDSQNNTNADSQNSSSQNDNSSPNSENISSGSSSTSLQNLIVDAGMNIAGVVVAEIVFDGSKSINSSGGEMSYSWNFGNGETASGKIVKYVYKYPGHYIASLTVSSGSYQNSDQAEVLIYPAGIFISEFLPSPEGADEENEWIEIANDSDLIADISDFQIGDGSDAVFKIPKNTFIAPKSFLVFARKATKISLNNDDDKIVLYYPRGEIADSVEYKDGAKEGFSAARTSSGGFLWTKNLTPGTANIFLSEGGLKSGTASPAQKIVSENNAGEIKSFSASNFSAVGGQLKGSLLSFLPEVSAKTVDGYDELDLAEGDFSAKGGISENDSIRRLADNNLSAFLIDSLKNKTAAALILVPSIILSALAFVFRRKFWK